MSVPNRARRLCSYPGCRSFALPGSSRCAAHQWQRVREYKRPPWHAWYNDPRWDRLRDWQLARDPFCYYCAQKGIVTAATCVDHAEPHNGDWDKFMNPGNLRSSCKRCHDQKTAAEDGGFGNPKRYSQG
ncbi:MAG: HNH endonuclease [Clostridia bacterium]|nr:HNH endonuclease [Clostridia bacterium]